MVIQNNPPSTGRAHMSSKFRRVLVFVVPLALAIGGGLAWYEKYRVDLLNRGYISHELKSAAEDLITAGIGNSLKDEPWFTKTDIHALSFYSIVEGNLNVILRHESSDRFFIVTEPKFMRQSGFKTYSENKEMCLASALLRVSNTLVLASDKNLYNLDPFYGCTSSHREYIKQYDAATQQVQYNSLLVHPEFDSSTRTQ